MHTWYMYLDRCVYTYIYMHFFMLICSSVCSYYMIYKHIYTYINIYIKIHIHEHIYIYKQIYKQIYVYTLPYSCFLASFEVLSNKTLVKLWDRSWLTAIIVSVKWELFFFVKNHFVVFPKRYSSFLSDKLFIQLGFYCFSFSQGLFLCHLFIEKEVI